MSGEGRVLSGLQTPSLKPAVLSGSRKRMVEVFHIIGLRPGCPTCSPVLCIPAPLTTPVPVGGGWYPEIFISPHPILPQESGLIQLLRRDIAAVFRDHRMIAVCQNVAMSAEDKLLLRHQLRKHKILIKVFPNQVLPHLGLPSSHAC